MKEKQMKDEYLMNQNIDRHPAAEKEYLFIILHIKREKQIYLKEVHKYFLR